MKKMKMKINEIFYSLQGEGYFSGNPAIFIRLSGCNLQCNFCDTNHKNFIELSNEEIYNLIKNYPCKHIVFTGGEPSLQINFNIIDFFKKKDYFIQIETNGTRELPTNIDWITCSPKDLFCSNTKLILDKIDELKVIFDGKNDISKYLEIKASYYYLQPCDVYNLDLNLEILKKCIDYILKNPKWRLSLQSQKILNIK